MDSDMPVKMIIVALSGGVGTNQTLVLYQHKILPAMIGARFGRGGVDTASSSDALGSWF